MSGEHPLAPWARLQALYTQQLIELERPEVDLARVSALARQSEALLVRLSAPGSLRASDEHAARRMAAAATQAQALLRRTTDAFQVVRARLLQRARQRQRASAATLAYRAKAVRAAPRFLDLRR